MKVYNTLTKQKEDFVPLQPGKVTMYVCGPTVYNLIHIGNARPMIVFDTVRRYMEHKGYEVNYVSNFTDVDDKIIAKSRETGIPADKYAADMIEKIDKIMAEFDVGEPTLWLKATENIGNIIDFIQKLIDGGHAYSAKNGDVYFAVDSFKRYGCLSNRSVEDMLDGVRVDNNIDKRNPADFCALEIGERGRDTLAVALGLRVRPGWTYRVSVDEPHGVRR